MIVNVVGKKRKEEKGYATNFALWKKKRNGKEKKSRSLP